MEFKVNKIAPYLTNPMRAGMPSGSKVRVYCVAMRVAWGKSRDVISLVFSTVLPKFDL